MVRRFFLKGFLSLTTLFFFSFDLAEGIRSAFSADKVRVPSSTVKALRTGDPDLVATFVLKHPRNAANASLQQRIEMLKLMKLKLVGKKYAHKGMIAPDEYERAALILLKQAERAPKELNAIVDGLEGRYG